MRRPVAYLPASQEITLAALFDTDLVTRRKQRAVRQFGDDGTFLLHRVVEDLVERLAPVQRRFAETIVLHAWSPIVRDALLRGAAVDRVHTVETAPGFGGDRIAPVEAPALDLESCDLAVSLLNLHAVDDLPGVLVQIRRSLRPDGLFIGCFPGRGTLEELKTSLAVAEAELSGGASPRVSPFADVRDAGALLQRAGFALPVADVEAVTVRYASMFDLMRDLRAMGETSSLLARRRTPDRRTLFLKAAEVYAERFSDPDGRIRATFSLIWLSGWAPHASQQKPAARGSATTSLAEALERAGRPAED